MIPFRPEIRCRVRCEMDARTPGSLTVRQRDSVHLGSGQLQFLYPGADDGIVAVRQNARQVPAKAGVRRLAILKPCLLVTHDAQPPTSAICLSCYRSISRSAVNVN